MIPGLVEWQECRGTIARFDGYLAEIRKYGFTLVTVLLTANALITTSNTGVDRPVAAVVVMALVVALFMLDNYYWSLLRGVVVRAREIEDEEHAGQKLTSVVSEKVKETHSTELILLVYAMFILVAGGIGLTAGALAAKPSPAWLDAIEVMAALLALTLMGAAFLYVQKTAPPSTWFYKHLWPKRK